MLNLLMVLATAFLVGAVLTGLGLEPLAVAGVLMLGVLVGLGLYLLVTAGRTDAQD